MQAFKAYNIKGDVLAGPVSVVDFWGQGVKGHLSDVSCEHHASPFRLLDDSKTEIASPRICCIHLALRSPEVSPQRNCAAESLNHCLQVALQQDTRAHTAVLHVSHECLVQWAHGRLPSRALPNS